MSLQRCDWSVTDIEFSEIVQFGKCIAEKDDVYKIILYSQRITPRGIVTGFKICVVVNDGNPDEIESRIYVEYDLSVPFDVIVYTKEKWNILCATPFSFASRVEKMGKVIYG